MNIQCELPLPFRWPIRLVRWLWSMAADNRPIAESYNLMLVCWWQCWALDSDGALIGHYSCREGLKASPPLFVLTSLYYSHHTLLHSFRFGLRFFNCNSFSGSVKSSSETLVITLTNTKTTFVIYTPEISLFVYVSLQWTPTYQHFTQFVSFIFTLLCWQACVTGLKIFTIHNSSGW